MVADHELVGGDRGEAAPFVEAPGAVVVDVDAELEVLGANGAGSGSRPVHQSGADALAGGAVEDVKLAQLDRAPRALLDYTAILSSGGSGANGSESDE